MRITRLRITNYRGIEALDAKVPASGVLVKGRCKSGKTSVIKAIRAALAARDISADAIHGDADRAEILVDLDDRTVRRLITRKGDTLSISPEQKKPQTWLNEMLGTAPLDPIDFYLAKPDVRREILLKALPITVTEDQVAQWIGVEGAREAAGSGKLTGHGLTVCTTLHAHYYDLRTQANARLKAALDDLTALDAAQPTTPEIPVSRERAAHEKEKADRQLAEIRGRASRIAAREERTRATRATIASKREEALKLRLDNPIPTVDERAALTEKVTAQAKEVSRLEQALDTAREALHRVSTDLALFNATFDGAKSAHALALDRETAAVELERTLDETAEAPVTEEETSAALDAADSAAEMVADAEASAKSAEWNGRRQEAARKVSDTMQEADSLNATVIALAKDAPEELLKASNGIPGLRLDGDQILLDGVSLDGRSGMEQLSFAIQVARRVNARSKILVVDGLERVDSDSLPAFIREATADGYQLIATRVDQGEITLEAIEPEEV